MTRAALPEIELDPQPTVAGTRRALARSRTAHNYFDYRPTLLAYINGFRDGHTNVVPAIDATFYEWPGFLPATWPCDVLTMTQR